MSQMILPLTPKGATQINGQVSVWRDDKKWTYFVGLCPVYCHDAEDIRMFRMVTAQLVESNACRQVDIIKTFGVSKRSVIRAVKKLRKGGARAFFVPRQRRRGGTVLIPDVLEKAQSLLNQGISRKEISEDLEVKYATLRKAINDGRLQERNRYKSAATKSNRSAIDIAAADGMGVACTRVDDRIMASLGKCIGAAIQFESSLDVPKAGVLCALPTLLINGLLHKAEQLLGKLTGYYTTFHILLLLAFMSLCRIKSTEKLRGYAPGEFGKMLGLDRIPEVRCLRGKMDDYNTPQKLDKGIRWMLACHTKKEDGYGKEHSEGPR